MRKVRSLILVLILAFFCVIAMSYLSPLKRFSKLEAALVNFREASFNAPVGLGEVKSAAWSPDGRQLIFSAGRFTAAGRKVWSLYKVVDAAKHKIARIGNYSGLDEVQSFSFSPDGHFLAVEFRSQFDTYVKLLNLETNTFFPLPSPKGISFQSVSIASSALTFMPDGKKLLFWGFNGKSHHLCYYDLDSGESGLLPISLDAFEATWSSSGDRILFLARKGRDVEIMTANPDGSNPVALFGKGKNFCPRYSPYGNRIAFLEQDQEKVSSTLGIMKVDGNEMSFTRGLPEQAEGLNWSSDGGKIFFQARNKNQNWQIYAYSLKNDALQKITDQGANLYPAVNPIDSRLAFVSDRSVWGLFSLYVFSEKEKKQERITGWFFP